MYSSRLRVFNASICFLEISIFSCSLMEGTPFCTIRTWGVVVVSTADRVDICVAPRPANCHEKVRLRATRPSDLGLHRNLDDHRPAARCPREVAFVSVSAPIISVILPPATFESCPRCRACSADPAGSQGGASLSTYWTMLNSQPTELGKILGWLDTEEHRPPGH